VTARRRLVAVILTVALVTAALPAGVASGQTDAVRQETTVSLADGDVQTTVSYRLPDRVSGLTVRFPALAEGASLVEASGFRRVGDTEFEWTDEPRPSVTFRVPADDRRIVAGDGWAMAVRPDTSVSYSFRGDDPGFRSTYAVSGEGYAADPLAYLGPHRTSAVSAGGERTTFVVADAADDPEVGSAREFLRAAPGRFDFGVRRDQTTAFVLPERTTESQRRLAGATAETSFWVGPSEVRMGRTDTAFTHEYVHTRLGVTGEGSAAWLTEGSAEYFGHAFALNAGAGDYEEFRRGIAAERYAPDDRPVTLADRSTWRGTLGNYEKGAHVLAALDAEIRDRTDGQHTLADVFAASAGDPYDDHADFARTVREVTGEDFGPWLDRYVRGEELPPVPEDATAFVYGADLDPDADGATSAAERRAGTNPFVATDGTVAATTTPSPTPTPTATPTPTPTPTETADTATTTATEPSAGFAPGFGAVATLVALSSLALLARRRDREPPET
jgi:PGF-CTERM protein